MVGAAEVEVDLETGEVQVVDYAACVDCGTPINPNLTRVQAEGGILQGIGMALSENVTYDDKGRLAENSLLQYRVPPGWISVISGWILPPVMSSAGHLVQSPSVRWSSTPLVLPLRMRCITPSVVVFMSCPFCRSRWQWQLL